MLFVLCTIPIFFFNDTATTEIYTLSLHDALPISEPREARAAAGAVSARPLTARADAGAAARADAHREEVHAAGGHRGAGAVSSPRDFGVRAHRGEEIGRASCRERV